MSDVTNPAKEAASFLSILYAHISDLETGAYMHWYFEVQTEIQREMFQDNTNKRVIMSCNTYVKNCPWDNSNLYNADLTGPTSFREDFLISLICAYETERH